MTRNWLSFLSPGVSSCLACSQMVRSPQKSIYLCSDCFVNIPWIKQVVCRRCGRPIQCHDCEHVERSSLIKNRSAVRYDDVMREWLAQYKYRGNERLLPLFGEMMVPLMRTMIQSMPLQRIVLTFVPLSVERLHERGFNQAEQLAHYIGARTNIEVSPLLVRTKHSHKQSFKTKKERMLDLEHVFQVDTREQLCFQRGDFGRATIVMIDDVYTTGSTLKQCAHVIDQKIPTKIYSLTWARA